MELERLHDACGIVGIYAREDNEGIDVRRYLTLALTALQHRGQESAGMAVYDCEGNIAHRVSMGKVREVFSDTGTGLPATYCGIGHVRYSTTGSSCVENAGPFVVGPVQHSHEVSIHAPLRSPTRIESAPQAPLGGATGSYTTIAVAHNGNLVNGAALREQLPQEFLHSTTDSEVIALLLLLHPDGTTLRERMIATFPLLRGAYSLVILAEGKLYAVRDPWGLRPLCIGRIGDSWVVASESCALDRIGATFVRKVEPGELITIDERGMQAEILMREPLPWYLQGAPVHRQTLCVFEYIYFSDATTRLNNRYVYLVREALGRELAKEHPVDADLVVPVPDSSIPAALGYAAASGIPYGQAIIKNRYSDRTFIKPDQRLRQLEVDLKFNLVEPKIDGARLVIVDDSIVRGNTMKRLVAALRHRGVKEIHLRSSAPPLRHPCYFGIDIPQEEELIAAGRTVQQVADYIGVDSLGYLSVAGLGRAIDSATGRQSGEASLAPTPSVGGGLALPSTTLDEAAARNFLHNEFCYGCMERQGWPFDPQMAMNEAPRRDIILATKSR